MIITIDGPSGTGKTTVAKLVADRLHFLYFDTGALYRAVTWLAIDRSIPASDIPSIKDMLQHFDLQMVDEEGKRKYLLADRDITEEIRSIAVTERVSAYSAMQEVRAFLLTIQREFALKQNVVFEGRDLGSVVFPQAEIKIFLTADPVVRARRRHEELVRKETKATLDQQAVLEAQRKRDAYDSSREIAPLQCPNGAFVVDTTDLTIEQVVEKVVGYAKDKVAL